MKSNQTKQLIAMALALAFPLGQSSAMAQQSAAPAQSSGTPAPAEKKTEEKKEEKKEEKPGKVFPDPFKERLQVIEMYPEKVSVNFYPGGTGRLDKHYLLENYLPLANLLSHKLQKNVSFVFERDPKHQTTKVKDKSFHFYFVTASEASKVTKDGKYIPLARHSDDTQEFVGALIVKSSSPIKKLEDVKGKKMGWVSFAQISQLMRYNMLQVGISPKTTTFVDAGSAGQNGLRASLDSGAIDGAIVRLTIAQKWKKEAPDDYNIVANSFRAPGFTLLVPKEKENDPLTVAMQQAWLEINPKANDADEAAMLGVKAGAGLTGTFVPATPADFAELFKAGEVVKEQWIEEGAEKDAKKDAKKEEKK